MRQTVKRGEKAMQKSILTKLSIKIHNARQRNGNNRTQHGFLHNLFNEAVVVCPWITYDNRDAVVVMEELTNEAEVVTAILNLAAATDIVQILCTYFTLLHIKLYNF